MDVTNMNLDTIEERLRTDYELPGDFVFWKWRCFPETGRTIYVEFTGGRCPLVKRGRRAGKPNYLRASDRRVFNVPVQEADQWEREYEEATGSCRHCRGSGQRLSRIDLVKHATEYRECYDCRGSGQSQKRRKEMRGDE